jgi:hypothetical protein
MSILALILCILAFVSPGLAMEPHHRRLGGSPGPMAKACMRFVAAAALLLAFLLAILASGWIFGPILWAGEVMLGAGIAFLALNFTPTRQGRSGGTTSR